MISANVRISGSKILLHNGRTADPLNEFAKRSKELSTKKNKTDSDYLEMKRIDFEGALYLDPEIGPYIPDENIATTLIMGARKLKRGQDAAQIIVEPTRIKLLYKGPRDLEGIWNAGMYDYRGVRVRQSRIYRCRPSFTDWSLEFQLLWDEGIANPKEVEAWLRKAGEVTGLCDYRPRYGRFLIEKFAASRTAEMVKA